MEITWVNHASFIASHNNVHLICDPWLEGTAFNQGWALVSKTVMPYEDFKDITHIWFSHEHPDHFSPPCIAKIPLEYRKNITVLFQITGDQKVIEYCKKMEFKEVIEMLPKKYYSLAPNFTCSCGPYTDGDSWLHIKTDTHSLLNLNDCSCETSETSKAVFDQLDGGVDILLTQFSYAVRTGNKEDIALRKASSAKKLASIQIQAEVFSPKTIIPFASYVYFCHTDNHYMNDAVNKIGYVHSHIEKEIGIRCNVMYPGDKWILSQPYESTSSINRYDVDYQKISQANNANLILSKKVSLEDLQDMAHQYSKRIKELHGNSIFFHFFIPTKIYIEDYQQSFSFDLKRGLSSKDFSKERCDISLNSDALTYCFTHLWGGDSLQINGRFQVPKKGNYAALRQYFKLSSWANQGIQYTTSQFLKSIIKVVLNKFIQV